ncbi:MAG TPA: carbohydrate kinase family protein [Candidatus Paceibacterota bacterium]|nr:carbohydrate kinase family protein [Candidatus Paceibacterota bacterium]
MAKLDFLAIGDIVSEPFIRLKDAYIATNEHDEENLCMRFGDKIPYDSVTFVPAVGNASNAAVAAARLGLASALRGYVGNDRYGKECLEVLEHEGVDTAYMVTQAGKQTNYHFVLWYDTDRTILVKHEEFDYAVPEMEDNPTWVYLSSLAANSLSYHDALADWLIARPEIKFAFQPGTFQMSLGVQKLRKLYERSDLFFCNREEAARILGHHETGDIKALLTDIRGLGPKIAVITDGTDGAYAFDGSSMYFIPMYPDTRGPYERTGAGDAFASTVCAALALGKPLEEALLWGPINSMSVVQDVGAQKGLLARAELEAYLKSAPESYRISTI